MFLTVVIQIMNRLNFDYVCKVPAEFFIVLLLTQSLNLGADIVKISIHLFLKHLIAGQDYMYNLGLIAFIIILFASFALYTVVCISVWYVGAAISLFRLIVCFKC